VHFAPTARDPVASGTTPITGPIPWHSHGQRFVPKNGAGLNPRQDHVLTGETYKRTKPKFGARTLYDVLNRSVQWHRLALRGKLAEPGGSVKHQGKFRKNHRENLK
jgi:hypothetical protein